MLGQTGTVKCVDSFGYDLREELKRSEDADFFYDKEHCDETDMTSLLSFIVRIILSGNLIKDHFIPSRLYYLVGDNRLDSEMLASSKMLLLTLLLSLISLLLLSAILMKYNCYIISSYILDIFFIIDRCNFFRRKQPICSKYKYHF